MKKNKPSYTCKCDNCKKEMVIKLQQRRHGKNNKVIETIFRCPYCKTTFTCGFTVPEIRKLQIDQQQQKQPPEEFEARRVDIEAKMKALKEQYGIKEPYVAGV